MRNPLDLFSTGKLSVIEKRAFWVVFTLVLSFTLLSVEIDTLVRFALAKLTRRESAAPDLSLFDGALATLSLALLVIGVIDTPPKRRVGRIFLLALNRILSSMGYLTDWIIRKRRWTGALGWISLTLSVVSFIYLMELKTHLREQEVVAERQRESYNQIIGSLVRVVESEPVAVKTQSVVVPLITRYEDLRLTSKIDDKCDTQLEQTICAVYSACPNTAVEIFDEQTLRANIAELIEQHEQRLHDGHSLPCKGSEVSGHLLDAWLGRLQLVSSNHGTALAAVVDAHGNLLRTRSRLAKLGRRSPMIENALGNIYAYYLSNYVNLYTEYSWRNAFSAPVLGRGEMNVVRSEIINQATRAMERARRFEPMKSFAESRYVNNMNDLTLRLVPVILTSPSDIGALEERSLASREIRTAVGEIRSNPQAWIAKAKRDLLLNLQDRALPEGFITYAQLASLEISLDRNAEQVYGPPYLSPVSALSVAHILGFHDRSFFLGLRENGLCPLYLSKRFGSTFNDFLVNQFEIDAADLEDECGRAS